MTNMTGTPAVHTLHHVLTFITALGCIHIGAMALGYNILDMGFLMPISMWIEYFFGICGLISLALVVFHGTFCHCMHCEKVK
ncbi:MAG: hypothetical protein WDZ41_04690 [Candidatus Babeliales bacterium]